LRNSTIQWALRKICSRWLGYEYLDKQDNRGKKKHYISLYRYIAYIVNSLKKLLIVLEMMNHNIPHHKPRINFQRLNIKQSYPNL